MGDEKWQNIDDVIHGRKPKAEPEGESGGPTDEPEPKKTKRAEEPEKAEAGDIIGGPQ